MLEQLKRPFKRHYDKYRAKADGFVGPIKDSASKLFAMIPKMEAFAGSEDLAGEADAEAAGDVGVQKGLKAKLKNFKQSLKGLSDFQKLILLTIAVVLPAGIVIAIVLAGLIRRKK
jgi:hypothetical protein